MAEEWAPQPDNDIVAAQKAEWSNEAAIRKSEMLRSAGVCTALRTRIGLQWEAITDQLTNPRPGKN